MIRGTKTAALVRPLLVIGERHGLEPLVLRRWLSSPGSEADATSFVPIERVFALWASVAHATQDSALPLRAAKLLRVDQLGLMGFSIMTASTGHEAFTHAIRYAPLLTSSGEWRTRTQGNSVTVSWLRAGERWLGHRLANESGIAQFVSCMRQVFGQRFAPQRVSFRHAAPRSTAVHREFFQCPIAFGAADDGFAFASSVLDQAPPMANAALSAHLRAQAEALLAAREPGSTTSALRHAFEHELGRQDPDLSAARASRSLGISERTLRRRLKEEGTTLRSVLSNAQRDAAKNLLEHGHASLTEIALRVGFSDSSAFAHAARRWFGHSAGDLRRKRSS